MSVMSITNRTFSDLFDALMTWRRGSHGTLTLGEIIQPACRRAEAASQYRELLADIVQAIHIRTRVVGGLYEDHGAVKEWCRRLKEIDRSMGDLP